MSKKGIIVGAIAAAVIIGIVASYSSYDAEESLNLDMGQTHGTVSTAMGSPILGSPMAPITIIEFGDYQCHQCYNWFHNTKPAIFENYIDTGKANLIFVDLAILGRDSPKAAAATYCAEEQGVYWEFHDLLYTSQESQIDNGWASPERLKAFAFSLGLDMDLFDNCLDSGKFLKRVQFNTNEAKKQGATGTPTFIIVSSDGQQKIGGAQPFSVFKNIIDSMI